MDTGDHVRHLFNVNAVEVLTRFIKAGGMAKRIAGKQAQGPKL
jgi:hypothetical protein